MSGQKTKIKIAIKYCGSCNPLIDLPNIGRSVTDIISGHSDFELAPLSADSIDIVIILCGCPRTCGNKKDVRARAKHYLLISSENSNDISSLEANLLKVMKQ